MYMHVLDSLSMKFLNDLNGKDPLPAVDHLGVSSHCFPITNIHHVLRVHLDDADNA